MSFKEIKELRQAGKLEEALKLASEALQEEPDNIWNKRAIAWIYYEYLKRYAQPDSYDGFRGNLIKIKDLELPEDEKMVFDNCAWQIGSMVFALSKAEQVDYFKINELFEIVKEFHLTKPSEVYSFIYKAFHRGYHNWSNYLTFADWWGFEHFRAEDFLKEEYNGKKIMAIAEQAHIAYSKKLLEGEVTGNGKFILIEKIGDFIPKLDNLIAEHQDYQYPPYFKAKLLLAIGEDDDVFSAFLPFAKQKRNDFWVWQLMAEIFTEDEEKKFACYCKALSLKTPEDYIVKLRQSFAELLVDRQMYNEAKTEISRVIDTRSNHNWKLPGQISQWTEQEWYQSAKQNQDNQLLYAKFSQEAELILFQDIPEELVIVEFVNAKKKILNFVRDRTMYGFFNYAGFIDNPKVGDAIKVRFNSDAKEGFFKIVSAQRIEVNQSSEAIKTFKGTLSKMESNNFGFVDDIFIDSRLIDEYKLSNGNSYEGSALLSYNKKKNSWGWKAFSFSV